MTASVQMPTVGRIVHYVSHGTPVRQDGSQAFESRCRAAIVTEVPMESSTRIGLAVINPTGFFFHSLADGGCAAGVHGGQWHWPERVIEDGPAREVMP